MPYETFDLLKFERFLHDDIGLKVLDVWLFRNELYLGF